MNFVGEKKSPKLTNSLNKMKLEEEKKKAYRYFIINIITSLDSFLWMILITSVSTFYIVSKLYRDPTGKCVTT